MTYYRDGFAPNPIVVIPIYRPSPLIAERISLEQCGRVLGRHEIVFLCPEGLDTKAYASIIPEARFSSVEARWMSSLKNYNRLIMSPILFERFGNFSHMLLHEPDAIVINDDLLHWCAQDFDYIGAPWFEGYGDAQEHSQISGVGNSGFSLFRIEAARRATLSNARWYNKEHFAMDLKKAAAGNWNAMKRIVVCGGTAGELRNAWKTYGKNCDIFWSKEIPKLQRQFRVGSLQDALNFSWEMFPARCMVLNKGALPFGFHAWAKYDLPFLRPYLINAGVSRDSLDMLV